MCANLRKLTRFGNEIRLTWVEEKRMKRSRFVSYARLILAGTMFLNTQIAAQILRIGEMNTQQIHALDLAKTVILIPGGILEEHDPYLPSYADGYADDPIPANWRRPSSPDPAGPSSSFHRFRWATIPPVRSGERRYFPEVTPSAWQRCGRSTWT